MTIVTFVCDHDMFHRLNVGKGVIIRPEVIGDGNWKLETECCPGLHTSRELDYTQVAELITLGMVIRRQMSEADLVRLSEMLDTDGVKAVIG